MRSFLVSLIMASMATTGAANEADFEDRVRQFILENPEIILEALTILSEREERAAMTARIAEFPELFDEPAVFGIGPVNADLRVIEFFDYKCLPCKAIHPALVAFVEETPGVRIEMRHLPILTPGSERAARFALAVRSVAGEDAHNRVHDQLWEVKGPLNTNAFAKIAEAEGLDMAAIEVAMDSDAVTERITYNRDAAISLEILGTPAFVAPDSVTFGQADVGALADLWLNR
ncbi:MAG: DsbA family protein [Pseudomonadota bacterium]